MTGIAIFTTFRTVATFITVMVLFPYMIILLVIGIIIMSIILRMGMAPQRECLRMDSIYRSPIHSQFAMVVNGLVTFRSYEKIPYFRQLFINDLEKSTNVTFSYTGMQRFMATSMDYVCVLYAAGVTLYAVIWAKG